MITTAQKTLKGTVLKMAVGFKYPADNDITLDSIEHWYTEWYCKGKKLRIEKEDHIRVEDSAGLVEWFALVDTTITGEGALKMRLWADIPDSDADEGVRPEYAEVVTDVIIG